MDYMLVCYQDERAWNAYPEAERKKISAECNAYVDDMKREGCYRGTGRLQQAHTATTVRGEGGRALVTDGPFAETKEVLAGYLVVSCQNRAEALAIARRNPRLRYNIGSVEVRPLVAE